MTQSSILKNFFMTYRNDFCHPSSSVMADGPMLLAQTAVKKITVSWLLTKLSILKKDMTFKEMHMPCSYDKHFYVLFKANRLHLVSFQHKINQTGGDDMKDSVYADLTPTSYWTQNNRVHGKLGHMLGPGVPRERQVRKSFNILTGSFFVVQSKQSAT